MKLTPAAEAAWMIAAGEAAASGHSRIEPAHLLIGVLSLEKIGTGKDAVGVGVDADLARQEYAQLVRSLAPLALDTTRLRRRTRTRLGQSATPIPPTGPLSRSLACKALFAAAAAFAGRGRPVGVAHLFAALAEGVDSLTLELVRGSGSDPAALRDAALAGAMAPAPAQAAAPAPAADPPARVAAAPVAQVQAPPAATPPPVDDAFLDARLDSLEGFLAAGIVGQPEAVARLAKALRSSLTRPASGRRPRAALLFVGPHGIGKTEAARLAAEHLYGPAAAFLRFEARVLVEPAGIVHLAQALRNAPRGLLLVRGIEEAGARGQEVLRGLLTGARVVDPNGPADARSLAVVVTASSGVPGAAADPLGFLLATEAQPTDALGGLPPELLARFDDVVRFRELDADDVALVAKRALAAFVGDVGRRHGVRLRVTAEAECFAAERAAEAGLDVREARAIVERLVHGPLSALVLTGKLTRHPAWAAIYDEGGIYLLPEA